MQSHNFRDTGNVNPTSSSSEHPHRPLTETRRLNTFIRNAPASGDAATTTAGAGSSRNAEGDSRPRPTDEEIRKQQEEYRQRLETAWKITRQIQEASEARHRQYWQDALEGRLRHPATKEEVDKYLRHVMTTFEKEGLTEGALADKAFEYYNAQREGAQSEQQTPQREVARADAGLSQNTGGGPSNPEVPRLPAEQLSPLQLLQQNPQRFQQLLRQRYTEALQNHLGEEEVTTSQVNDFIRCIRDARNENRELDGDNLIKEALDRYTFMEIEREIGDTNFSF